MDAETKAKKKTAVMEIALSKRAFEIEEDAY